MFPLVASIPILYPRRVPATSLRARAACVQPVGDGDAVIESGIWGMPSAADAKGWTAHARPAGRLSRSIGTAAWRRTSILHRNLILLVGRDGTARRTAQRMYLQLAGILLVGQDKLGDTVDRLR
jgi:hypothetical protein